MIFQNKTAMPHYQFNFFQKEKKIKHFVSTRNGGVSKAPYQSLNLGLHTDDEKAQVIENRKRFSQGLIISLSNFCFAEQVHETQIVKVTSEHKSAGTLNYNTAIAQTDALITEEKNICLTILGADCGLLLFYDKKQDKIGACHAGWRGTVKKIAQKTVLAMQENFNSSPEDILIGIAPCISAEVYEVGEEVVNAVEDAFGTKEKYLIWHEEKKKYHFDLTYANIQQLTAIGIKNENIEKSDFCTYLNSDLFFSSRKDKGVTGRFGAGIMLV